MFDVQSADTSSDTATLAAADASSYLDVTPDGQEVVVTGDPRGDIRFLHLQGDNSFGFQEDCGLCSVQDILDQFGNPVTENDVVQFAVQNGLCDTSEGDPSADGGATTDMQVQLLEAGGVHA